MVVVVVIIIVIVVVRVAVVVEVVVVAAAVAAAAEVILIITTTIKQSSLYIMKRIEATSIYSRICLIRNGGLGFKHCWTTSLLDPGPWLQLCLRIRTVTMLVRR